MVEVRRLQRLGSTTLVVSLPSRWVKEKGLKQGDIVYIEEGPEWLKIQTTMTEHVLIRCTLNAEHVDSPTSLARLVTACYLQGYDEVEVESISGLTEQQTSEVQNAVERLPGFEVVEQDNHRILIRSILDPTKFTVVAVLKRMQLMCAAMINTAIDAVVEAMPEKAGEVSRTESKLDELYFLVVRQLLLSLRYPSVAVPLGIDHISAAGYRLVAKVLEEIGDHALVISKEGIMIRKRVSMISKQLTKSILDISDNVLTIFNKTMEAFFSVDFKLAAEVFDAIENESERIKSVELSILEMLKDLQAVVSLRVMLSRLTDILNACKIIAEVTTNKFVRRQSDTCRVEEIRGASELRSSTRTKATI